MADDGHADTFTALSTDLGRARNRWVADGSGNTPTVSSPTEEVTTPLYSRGESAAGLKFSAHTVIDTNAVEC
jgi:hypothetical protein